MQASALAGSTGDAPRRREATGFVYETVSVVVMGAPDGVTVAGVKPQAAPVGSPEQEKVTGLLKPLTGVIVMVAMPFWRVVAEKTEGSSLRVKSPEGIAKASEGAKVGATLCSGFALC